MRPKVSVDNHKQVYSHYGDYEPNAFATMFLHRSLATVFKPEITFADGAEETLESIFDSGRTIALVSNHTHAVDPCIIASMPLHAPVFEPLIGNTLIPAKESIQSKFLVGRFVDPLGPVPVFRLEDLPDPEDPAGKALVTAAARGLLKLTVQQMNNGKNLSIFAEGTRNKVDPTKLQTLYKGIGLMVTQVTEIEQPAMVPMAIWYDENGVRKPTVYVGTPSVEPFGRSREVLEWLPEPIQGCIDSAIEISAKRSLS